MAKSPCGRSEAMSPAHARARTSCGANRMRVARFSAKRPRRALWQRLEQRLAMSDVDAVALVTARTSFRKLGMAERGERRPQLMARVDTRIAQDGPDLRCEHRGQGAGPARGADPRAVPP